MLWRCRRAVPTVIGTTCARSHSLASTTRRNEPMAAHTYDYVIIGAGAAGSVVANRLSADPAARVLLLESGGKGRNPLLVIPAGFAKVMGTKVNWIFDTVPQK